MCNRSVEEVPAPNVLDRNPVDVVAYVCRVDPPPCCFILLQNFYGLNQATGDLMQYARAASGDL